MNLVYGAVFFCNFRPEPKFVRATAAARAAGFDGGLTEPNDLVTLACLLTNEGMFDTATTD